MTVSTQHPRLAKRFVLTIVFAILVPAPVPAPADTGARFHLHGQLHATERSTDGRFAISGTARFQPERSSLDSRFTVKVAHAPAGAGSCGLADPIFSNGFEP